MNNVSQRLSISSLVIAGVAFLAIPVGKSQVMSQNDFRLFWFLALVTAVVSVLLGIWTVATTRGEKIEQRIPAILGIGIGGILAVIYALINWLAVPF